MISSYFIFIRVLETIALRLLYFNLNVTKNKEKEHKRKKTRRKKYTEFLL
jgi:hypothetical protein